MYTEYKIALSIQSTVGTVKITVSSYFDTPSAVMVNHIRDYIYMSCVRDAIYMFAQFAQGMRRMVLYETMHTCNLGFHDVVCDGGTQFALNIW